MSERVVVEVAADGVAEVRLTRPERHNALDWAMFRAIAAAAEQVASDPSVRAVVLHGAGPSFSSGLDVPSFSPGGPDADVDVSELRREGDPASHAQRVALDWARLPVPVIAALHGAAFGGGLQIALGADVRIAAPDARLCVMELQWGLVPDMGLTRTLPPLVGADVAKLLVLGAEEVDGVRARELGLVTEVADDPVARAFALARRIASFRPEAVRHAKALLDRTRDADEPTALALEVALSEDLIGSRFAPSRG